MPTDGARHSQLTPFSGERIERSEQTGPLSMTTASGISDTWASRDLPILAAALRRLDAGEDPSLEDIRADAGLTVAQLAAGLKALEGASPPYIEVGYTGGWTDDQANGWVDRVSERARRELGAWPSAASLVADLVEALSAAADAEPEPERKSRLRTAADFLGGAARDVAVSVLAQKIGTV
jgi:hypothetical protein